MEPNDRTDAPSEILLPSENRDNYVFSFCEKWKDVEHFCTQWDKELNSPISAAHAEIRVATRFLIAAVQIEFSKRKDSYPSNTRISAEDCVERGMECLAKAERDVIDTILIHFTRNLLERRKNNKDIADNERLAHLDLLINKAQHIITDSRSTQSRRFEAYASLRYKYIPRIESIDRLCSSVSLQRDVEKTFYKNKVESEDALRTKILTFGNIVAVIVNLVALALQLS